MERNTEYDPFAAIYNRYWGEDYRAQALPIVERLLLAHLPARSSVLDVCCGTGQFASSVATRGFKVSGIDASAEMIRFARQNAPDVDFTVADVREFSLGRRYDAAFSVFESLNHVPDQDGLKSAFAQVHSHLKPNASFLFDLNGDDAFLTYWNETNAIVEDDQVCVMRSEYDEESRVGTCNITTFRQNGAWTRADFTVRQTCHDRDAVHDALLSAGFGIVSLYDSRDAGMTGDIAADRTFFLATAK